MIECDQQIADTRIFHFDIVNQRIADTKRIIKVVGTLNYIGKLGA